MKDQVGYPSYIANKTRFEEKYKNVSDVYIKLYRNIHSIECMEESKCLRGWKYVQCNLFYCMLLSWHMKQMRYLNFKRKWQDSNPNHLVCKRTLNHLATLAKWLNCPVSTYRYGGFDSMLLWCHVRVICLSAYLSIYLSIYLSMLHQSSQELYCLFNITS